MPRIKSWVRAIGCQSHLFRPLPRAERWGEAEAAVQLQVGLKQTYGLWKRGCLQHVVPSLTFFLYIIAVGLALLLFPGCKPKALTILLEPSQAMSSVLADEAALLAGAKKEVSLITPDSSWGPPSSLEEGLKAALKKKGLKVVVAKSANLGNPMLSGTVGLKAADFLEVLGKSTSSGAVISLVGAPLLTSADTGRLGQDHPPVLVVATAMLGDKMGVRSDPVELARLLETEVIQMAIIDGAEPAANAPGKPDPARELFAKNYRILRRPR